MFWQLRNGLSVAGVSVHKMTQTIDSGPLWSRAPVQLPSGIGELQAELPLEAPLPRTLIRYSGGRTEALAVQRALGKGELQPGPTPPDTGIAVLLGQDWRP